MGSRRLGIAVIAAWLGLAVLGGAQATGNFPRQRINPEFARALAWHRSTLEPAALDALAALPAAERKQRLDAVIAANPDDPVAHLIRASADYELDDAAGTLRDVDAVLAAGVPVESVEGAVFALRAEALMDLGRNAEALADSERAVAADANGQYVSTRFSHGWALHLVRHDDALALRELDAALAREPDEVPAPGAAGRCCCRWARPSGRRPTCSMPSTCSPTTRRGASIWRIARSSSRKTTRHARSSMPRSGWRPTGCRPWRRAPAWT